MRSDLEVYPGVAFGIVLDSDNHVLYVFLLCFVITIGWR
jgi:hypothetical protein